MKLKLTMLILMGLTTTALPAGATEVAITVDDLPVHGVMTPGVDGVKVAHRFLDVFERRGIQRVHGFVNGYGAQDETGMQVLKDWTEAGQLLGNHTYGHIDLARVPSEDYIADIEKNEEILSSFSGARDFRYFRYPYLSEGDTAEKRKAIRDYLFSRRYSVAQVTVDSSDWAWNEPYVRCKAKEDRDSLEALRKSFLKFALGRLSSAQAMSKQAVGRPIRQVLLLHFSEFTAWALPSLLDAYDENGVSFIDLKRALGDEAYRMDTGFVSPVGYTFLEQLVEAKGIAAAPAEPTPLAVLDGYCR